MNFNNEIDRKTFLRTAGSTALFAALGIKLTGCDTTSANDDPPEGIVVEGNTITLNLDVLQGLKNQGGWLLINAALTLVVNVDGTLIRAFSSVCPHQGCTTNWQYANERFRCTCHNSIFANDGTRLEGPATNNLTEFSVQRNGNIVVITKSTFA